MGWLADRWHQVEEEDLTPAALRRGVPMGFLAMLPLWLAYEVSISQSTGGLRNASEMVLTLPLRPAAAHLDLVRRCLLGAFAFWALIHCARRHLAIVPMCLRIVFEGILGALLLGPLLVFLMGHLGDALPALPKLGEHPIGDGTFALFAFGGAAWEEILFRVGLFALLYLLVAELLAFGGVTGRSLRVGGQLFAAVLASLAFAAFHLEPVLRFLGSGGEPFRPALFTYRFLAGMLLVAILRLRGPGVAAWSHGVFNLALCLGAGPAVFQ
ncbi:MAG: CPBP family glutamic-type intramembrane protease [Planctomycetota bacterium]